MFYSNVEYDQREKCCTHSKSSKSAIWSPFQKTNSSEAVNVLSLLSNCCHSWQHLCDFGSHPEGTARQMPLKDQLALIASAGCCDNKTVLFLSEG